MANKFHAIEFKEVSLAFDDNVVLDRVSFAVRYGESKVVMGGSGTGKSTLLRLALGLIKPDSGSILIDGENITDYTEEQMMEVRQKIGMVFQEGALFDSLSVYDNVAYRLREQKARESEIEPIVMRMLRFVDLEDAADKMPNELSGGDRKSTRLNSSHLGISYAVFCLSLCTSRFTLFPYTTLFRSEDRDGLSGGRVVRQPLGLRQRRLPTARTEGARVRDRADRHAHAAVRRPGGRRGQDAERAFGGHAPARGHSARAGRKSEDHPLRRADRRPRPDYRPHDLRAGSDAA